MAGQNAAELDAETHRSAGWRWSLRPSVLGTLGLALSVFLWGYSYRISLYHSHPDTASRILVAKLWVDQRDAASPQLQQHASTGAIEPARLLSFHLIFLCALVVLPTRVRCARSRKSLLPPRSPPFRFFSA